MAHASLLEYFGPDSRPPDEIAVAWRAGYRLTRWSYRDLFHSAAAFGAKLRSVGLAKGDRVLLWGRNSGEWLAAFLGCIFCGAVVVPMDTIATKEFARRVAAQAGVRLAVIDHDLPPIALPLTCLVLDDFADSALKAHSREFSCEPAQREDPVEIVFTSGTTAEPRGVVLTHGNILANLEPLERQIAEYSKYERVYHPLSFLNLLPLSHVFGQFLGIFLPQLLAGTVLFQETLNPGEVMRTIKSERVSVVVAVPRLMESLKDKIERDMEVAEKTEWLRKQLSTAQDEHFVWRWWRFRRFHNEFGWKFWAFISGGAALDSETEE